MVSRIHSESISITGWQTTSAHLIVLVDLGESKSYWAHICETAVIWTQKGAKVFVPRHQTVDEGNFDKLTSVAAAA